MNFDIKKHNIGTTDRIIRAVVGALLIVGVVNGGSWVLRLVGAVLIGTAYLRYCPAYGAFDFSTDKDAIPASK
jgi:hypothetical protein